MARSIQYLLAG